MDNFNNLIDPNIEYSNIVYGGVGGGGASVGTTVQQQTLHIVNEPEQTQQNPELLLPQQQILDHPQPVMIDEVNNELKSTSIDDINRQTIIQTSTNHDNAYENEIDAVNPPTLENHTNYPAAEVTPADNNNTSKPEESEHLNNVDDEAKSNEIPVEKETIVPVATETKSVTTPKTSKANTTETNNNSKKDEEVDPNQCRVCLSKIDLIDIFLLEESNLRFSDKIIIICPNVRIIKNDYLPHFICTTCLQNLKIAYEFKKLCENTDNELRKKLKRSKNKLRRPTEFILIDCDDFSESSDDNKNPDDDEFHLSGSLSEADTSGSDYSTEKKRRRPPRRRAAAGRSNRSAGKRTTSNSSAKRKRPSRNSGGGGNSTADKKDENNSPVPEKRARREIVLIKATEDSDEEDDLPLRQRSTKATPASKSKTTSKTATPKPDAKPNICPYCDKVFPSQSQLREHKKVHSQDTPYICGNCTKEFKQKSNFTAHIMKHKDLSTGKMSCEKLKPKQSRTSGGGSSAGGGGGGGSGGGGAGSSSNSAQKTVGSGSAVGGSSGGGTGGGTSTAATTAAVGDKKKKSEFEMTNFGRDLFKCVAPLTTTYWSDSFSD